MITVKHKTEEGLIQQQLDGESEKTFTLSLGKYILTFINNSSHSGALTKTPFYQAINWYVVAENTKALKALFGEFGFFAAKDTDRDRFMQVKCINTSRGRAYNCIDLDEKLELGRISQITISLFESEPTDAVKAIFEKHPYQIPED